MILAEVASDKRYTPSQTEHDENCLYLSDFCDEMNTALCSEATCLRRDNTLERQTKFVSGQTSFVAPLSRLREVARNNLPSSLALPFDRLRTSDRLRERSMGKLFPGGYLKWIARLGYPL
jgi:hypothetical protein